MANANGWGDGASNNNIGWGKGADNAIGWGDIHADSYAGLTDIVGTASFSNTKSISLDGIDDFVDCGQVTQIQNTNALSVSFWFNYDLINTSADGLVSKDNSLRIDGNWYIALQSNQVRFLLKTANGQDALNSTTLSSGTWYHTLCVWNGSTMKIYINETLNNSISITNATGTLGTARAQDSVKIGKRLPTTSFYNGKIDEVAVWNSDQSANATTIYNSGVPNDISSLNPLSWWRCGDGDTSPTLTDNGSGGNDGTMTNFSTFSTDVPT
jgi:hypothetical protein